MLFRLFRNSNERFNKNVTFYNNFGLIYYGEQFTPLRRIAIKKDAMDGEWGDEI